MNSGGLRESLVSPGSDRKVNSSGSLNSSSARGRQHTRTPTNQPNPAGSQSPPSPAPRERLECLDAVRGLNVMLMIFVDNTGGFFPVGINHSPWDDITLADFVMPLFLFMVGVSMAFAFKKLGNRKATAKKVVSRTAKLFVLGVLTQGASVVGYGATGVDLANMRIPGILQRIAWAYCVVSLMELFLPKFTPTEGFKKRNWKDFPDRGPKHSIFTFYLAHWMVALAFFCAYLGIMLFMLVPSWSYTIAGSCGDMHCTTPVHKAAASFNKTCYQECTPDVTVLTKCDVRGDLTPKCSALRAVDVWLLGNRHLYTTGEFTRSSWCSSCSPYGCPKEGAPGWCQARLDPEGVLASIPTVLTTWLGLHFGKVLLHFPAHAYRIKHWAAFSVGLMTLGCIIHFLGDWKMNKQSWSPSYLFFMAGACGALLTLQYLIYDWKPPLQLGDAGSARIWQRPLRVFFLPARWVGMNTIFIYLLAPSAAVFESLQSWIYVNGNKDDTMDKLTYSHLFCYMPTEIAVPGVDPHAGLDYLTTYCHGGLFGGHAERWAILAWTVTRIAFWTGVAGWLHRIKWYWTL